MVSASAKGSALFPPFVKGGEGGFPFDEAFLPEVFLDEFLFERVAFLGDCAD